MDSKPNQHYVQQKYLEPWVKNGQILCLRLKKNIFPTNTRNVASERYFYSLNNLTDKDCNFIRKLILDKLEEPMKSLQGKWLEIFEKALHSPNLNLAINKNLKENMLKNVLEELYSNVENNGMPGLSKLQQGDISAVTEGGYQNKFLLYLSFQYFRTKKIKEAVRKEIGDYILYFDDFDAAFNLMAVIYSSLFSYYTGIQLQNNEMNVFLVENNTSTSFITGDQPVVNLLANFSGATTELELFYPLSPSRALLITKDKDIDVNCSLEKVREYNNMIEYQSLSLIFANDESILQQYKKCNK